MALRAVTDNHEKAAAIVSWTATILFSVTSQVIAVFSAIEIGPNLLTAITSIIGAIVLLGQIYLSNRVKQVKKHATANTEKIEEVKEKVDGG